MRILITSGLSEKEVGGPAQYGPNLAREFRALGHDVHLASYGALERLLPMGLRHLYFFLKIFWKSLSSDVVLTLDTVSVGLPSLAAALLCGKRIIVRIGGDFLWESYVERTGKGITLPQFNEKMPELTLKEELIFRLTKYLTHVADVLAFNTQWQKEIWIQSYKIDSTKTAVVRNYIPVKKFHAASSRNFLWAGRRIKLKNISLLEELAEQFPIEIVTGLPHQDLQEKIKNCYAVLMPSFSEVCPNFILEAASFGKPFIITKETGLKEIYNKGGIFVDPFDKKALKQAIFEMSDPVLYQRHKDDLLSLDKSRSWQEVAQEFLNLWN